MSQLPVLIVNDDPTLLDAVAEVCDSLDVRHFKTSTTSEALHLASLYDFSLAFIDLNFSDMTGGSSTANYSKRSLTITSPSRPSLTGWTATRSGPSMPSLTKARLPFSRNLPSPTGFAA